MISVVMAVYNGERYLDLSISSILAQTFKDFEFIIVDDGSTDSTSNILDEYASRDSRIKLIYQNHRGLTLSLIHGIFEARGEYIARQDADDMSQTTRLEKQLRLIDDSPGVSVVGCSWVNIDEDGLVFGKRFVSNAGLATRIEGSNVFAHGSLMFRKSAYYEAGGYSPSFPYAQDYDLILRMLLNGKAQAVYEPLYVLRLRRGSVSLTKGKEQERC